MVCTNQPHPPFQADSQLSVGMNGFIFLLTFIKPECARTVIMRDHETDPTHPNWVGVVTASMD
jgi:hypothetical protein